jgi:hypothetical protein
MAARSRRSREPGDVAWKAVEPYWRKVSIYGTPERLERDLRKVPPPVLVLLPVFWCNSEICNGGFSQLFLNSTGILVPEAIAGYRTLKRRKLANVVAKAASLLGKNYARDRSLRHKRLKKLGAAGLKTCFWPCFEKFDKRYFKLLEEEGLEETIDAYLQGLSASRT